MKDEGRVFTFSPRGKRAVSFAYHSFFSPAMTRPYRRAYRMHARLSLFTWACDTCTSTRLNESRRRRERTKERKKKGIAIAIPLAAVRRSIRLRGEDPHDETRDGIWRRVRGSRSRSGGTGTRVAGAAGYTMVARCRGRCGRCSRCS